MDSTEYAVRSEIKDIVMPKVLGNNQYKRNFIISLDGGYSSVKGISENVRFTFPSYAKKITEIDIVGKPKPTDIILTNHLTGEIWLCGSFAENTMDIKDVQSTTDESLYTRYRYNSDIYKAIMMTGLGLGLFNTDTSDLSSLNICLQSGLPSDYVKSDAGVFKKIMSGDYDFTLRVGERVRRFVFTLPVDNIGVMEQPRGTLVNIVYDREGHIIPANKEILNSDTLIIDEGFGTEDIFSLRAGSNIRDKKDNTYRDTAMKSVLEAVAYELNSEYGTSFKVFELQKFLKRGTVPVVERNYETDRICTKEIEFGALIEKYNRDLCTKSVKRLLSEYNNLVDYRYIIVTGGTGQGRIEYIRDMLSGLSHLTILPGNAADETIPTVYSNARGYYMSMLLKLQKASHMK